MRKYAFPIALVAIVTLAAVAVATGYHAEGAITVALFMADATAPALAVTEKDFKDATAALKTATDEVKRFADDAKKEMVAQGTLTAELRANIDKALTTMTGLAAQVSDIEQKLVSRGGHNAPAVPQTAGHLFTNNDEVKKLKSGWKGRLAVEMPTHALNSNTLDPQLLSMVSSLSNSAGQLVEEMRIPGVRELPRRRLTIRGLLAQGRTSSNAFRYMQETGFTNNARVVTEGQLKPQSDITFDAVTGTVSTIAHWFIASNQILDDAPGLRSMIDVRLRYGLDLVEEAELLRGDGTGEHLMGIIPSATDYAPPGGITVTNQTRIDTIRLAMLQVVLAEYQPDGVVMNPIDWCAIELTKTADGYYLMSNPAGTMERRLWGLPVVDTVSMLQDEFLVGAFGIGAQIFDRQDATVEASTEDSDNFRKNLVTIRGEKRLALAIYRPESFVVGDFGYVT